MLFVNHVHVHLTVISLGAVGYDGMIDSQRGARAVLAIGHLISSNKREWNNF